MSSPPQRPSVPPSGLSPRAVVAANPLFRSFWMAGYEGADHINGAGVPLSMNETTHHWQRLESDYALLAGFGIRTVRESLGWRITEGMGEQGLQRLRRHAQIAADQGIEVMWTLMHYGWPDDIDLLSPAFVDRFARFSAKVATALHTAAPGVRFYQPVNEISFLTWALSSTGMMRHRWGGSHLADAHAVKRQLVNAALRACEALAEADPGARFIHSDPVIDVVAHPDSGQQGLDAVRMVRSGAFEAWEMLMGCRAPELGGSVRHLDVVGVNYYCDNHWEVTTGERLHWHLKDPRRRPLSDMLSDVWQHLQRPLVIAETSHVGAGRGQWLDELASQALLCRQRGVPLEGICLYPIIDRHDWEDASHWHHSGLWDVQAPGAECSGVPASWDASFLSPPDRSLERSLCEPYAHCLRHWQQRLPGPGAAAHPARACSVSSSIN